MVTWCKPFGHQKWQKRIRKSEKYKEAKRTDRVTGLFCSSATVIQTATHYSSSESWSETSSWSLSSRYALVFYFCLSIDMRQTTQESGHYITMFVATALTWHHSLWRHCSEVRWVHYRIPLPTSKNMLVLFAFRNFDLFIYLWFGLIQ